MAPSKKKKKAASNPARGFATTSTASKPKHDDSNGPEIKAESVVGNQHVDDQGSGSIISVHNVTESVPEKALHELSPEELEIQLETSNLQMLVESYGEKSKKDTARQTSRLQTERRLLRSQADRLSVHQWLPTEILQIIGALLEPQIPSKESFRAIPELSSVASNLSEDDLLNKLWTLKRLLPQLGFSEVNTRSALRHLLIKRKCFEAQTSVTNKDSVWGLDECLDWLALTCEAEDLPSFDFHDERSGRAFEYQRSGALAEAGTPATTPTDSRSESPITRESSPERNQMPREHSPASSRSDSDSDLEPDQLITKFLVLQSRLHEISPELTEGNAKASKHARGRSSRNCNRLDANAKRKTARVRSKMERIRSDPLFDEDTANRKWAETRVQSARESAERKRFGIPDNNRGAQQEAKSTTICSLGPTETTQDDSDADGILGEFFSSLPDTRTDLSGGVSSVSISGQNGKSVQIRDFGRWNGISPRRILEEACRARDSSSRITYKPISASSFSNRHALEIRWSRVQEFMLPTPIDQLACEGAPRSAKIEMVSISCPTAAQSEAFISTVALFLVFASPSKEEKAHLRLPPTWRDLWKEMSQMKKEQDDAKERQVLRELRDMVAEHESLGQNVSEEEKDSGSGVSKREDAAAKSQDSASGVTVTPSGGIQAIWTSKMSSHTYQQMLTSRKRLPIWKFKDELLAAIISHQVVIICGETGCGKSTQVPAFIVEHELSNGRPCKVYCTEPRRISAISLARRVSEELGEAKGEVGTPRSLVGYAIRLESQMTTQTRLVYATTGIVMRMLERSNDLGDITHVVLDEVHERSIDSDFLLIVLRKLLVHRPDLKVVLMSATVDAQRFSDYLNQAPIMNVPGRTFPVETKYLEDAVEATNFNASRAPAPGIRDGEFNDDVDLDMDLDMDSASKNILPVHSLQGYSVKTRRTVAKLDEYRTNYDLIVRLLETVATSGNYSVYSKAILVFLPGIAEIRRLNDMLSGHHAFTTGWYIYALHSTIATDEQERAFLVPPPGIRKIVLATNIAETGITIPDVTCVIDTGKHKEMRFDERRQLSRLVEAFISRANAKQRRGRAGRVQKGLCFHLFTKERHDNIMPAEQTPEMLRLSLQDLVLRVKICRLGGIEQTLSEALDPPSSKNIRRAIDALVDVKALTAIEDLTPLGRQLAKLPLDVFLGKLILLGTIFGCLDAMITVAAILSSKSPFQASMGARSQAEVARNAFKKGDSDLLTVYNAYCAWRRICASNGMSEYQFCCKNFLNSQTLSNIEDLKTQLTIALADAGFIALNGFEKASLNKVRLYSRNRNFVDIPDRYNGNNSNDLILNSVIAWSFYPKLLRREGRGWKNVANNQAVSLHPTSVNKGVDQPAQWLSFYHIMQSSNKFYNAHETSPVESFAVSLVCGEAEFKMYSGVIVIDGNRLRFAVDEWKTMLAIKELRRNIRQIMTQAFRNPGRSLSDPQQAWLDVWQKIFANAKSKA